MFFSLPKRTAPSAAVVAFLLVVAACSSSSGDSSSSGTSGSTELPSCPSASEVNDTLRAELNEPDTKTTGSTRTCTYKVGPGGDVVVVTFTTGVSTADFDAAETAPLPEGETTEPIDGLGDAAYIVMSEETGSEVSTVSVLSGTTEVSVQAPLPRKFVEDLARELIS